MDSFDHSGDRTAYDQGGLVAESAALAALGNLAAFGPATAPELLQRMAGAAKVAGETSLPFKHAVLFAVLHELEFEGWASASHRRSGDRAIYSVTPDGHALLSASLERWRSAHLVIRACAAPRDREPEGSRP